MTGPAQLGRFRQRRAKLAMAAAIVLGVTAIVFWLALSWWLRQPTPFG